MNNIQDFILKKALNKVANNNKKVGTRNNSVVQPAGNADLKDIVSAYYPSATIKPASNPDAMWYYMPLEDAYKSSFVNPKLAEKAFKQSQKARRRNPDLQAIPSDKNVHANNWVALMDGDNEDVKQTWLNAMVAPEQIGMMGWNGVNGGTNPKSKNLSLWEELKYELAPSKPFRGFSDPVDKELAVEGVNIGPHTDLISGLGIVPRNADFGGFINLQEMGGSNNIRDINAHELQHHAASNPTVIENLDDYRNITGVSTDRQLYSLEPSERYRAYHSMKAMASDLSGKVVNNYDQARAILLNNQLLKIDPKYEKLLRPKILRLANVPYKVNYDAYEKLLKDGKIKPTDMSMIEDVMHLNQLIEGGNLSTGKFIDLYRNHGANPYTGESLDNEQDNKELWKTIRDSEFEEANNRKYNTDNNNYYA